MKSMILRRRNGEEGVLRYDDADAVLIEQHNWHLNGGHKGRVRYAEASINGRAVKCHRLVLGQPEGVVDHIDGDGLNNVRSNLRVVTHAENIRAAYALHGSWVTSDATYKHGITFHPKVLKSGAAVVYAYDRKTKKRLSDAEVAARIGEKRQCI